MQFPPPAAAAAWIDTMDGLSRGLNHALSNRINTLNTLLAVLQDAHELDAEIEGALLSEEGRFESVLKLYRLMPIDSGGAPEPMVLLDPVNDAVAMFGHHLDLRMIPCTVAGLEAAPPVRSRRQALTQAILVLLVAVGRPVSGHTGSAGGVELVLSATEDVVELRGTTLHPVAGIGDESAWTLLEWLASTLNAEAARGSDGERPWVALRLTTLAADRKKGR